jgi:hypothetical protein
MTEKEENKMDMNAMMEAYAKPGTPDTQRKIVGRLTLP